MCCVVLAVLAVVGSGCVSHHTPPTATAPVVVARPIGVALHRMLSDSATVAELSRDLEQLQPMAKALRSTQGEKP